MKLIYILLLLFSLPLAQATDLSQSQGWITIPQSNGAYINLTGQQNFSVMNIGQDELNISINDSYSVYSSTANLTLGNISYVAGVLNFTANASSGTMTVISKVPTNFDKYNFMVDGALQSQVVSVVSEVIFTYDLAAFHNFEIIIAPFINDLWPVWREFLKDVPGDYSAWTAMAALAVMIELVSLMIVAATNPNQDVIIELVFIVVGTLALIVVFTLIPSIGTTMSNVYDSYNP